MDEPRTTIELATARGSAHRAFHVMIKPVGPVCNLSCAYCFYLDKTKYYPDARGFRMTREVLESFIRQYIEAQEVPEVTFGWQGGEPTLLGTGFFHNVVALQRKYLPPGMRLINAFQTNGTLLDDEWCRFFKENDFLVGISLDGPKEVHDRMRRDRSGGPTFDAVLRGLRLLQKHGVEHNALCVVHRFNSGKPRELYRFFKEEGVRFLQFIPLVERLDRDRVVATPVTGRDMSERTVPAKDYGRFLCSIFDEWVARDVGKIYVQIFEAAFASRLGKGSGLCLFEPTCGKAMALEHNGDLYACDHFVFPEYRLGNIIEEPLRVLAGKVSQVRFGNAKADALPGVCRDCSVLSLCRGECPKNRFLATGDGEPDLNYLCDGLKMFFQHALPSLDWMARAYRAGRAPADIMLAGREPSTAGTPGGAPHDAPGPKSPGRNTPCPCGSGKKFKRCCGK